MKSRFQTAVLLGVFLIIPLCIRALAAWGDFWFDEIVSRNIALSLSSWKDSLSHYHDNNHILNTLYLMLIGEDATAYRSRLMAVFCSWASLAFFIMNFRKLGGQNVLSPLLIGGYAYPLVLYGSEARGYSSLILCLLASLYFLLGFVSKPSYLNWIMLLLFVCVGLLSHASFLQAIVVFLIVAIWKMWCLKGSIGKRSVLLLALALALLGPASIFWFKFARFLPAGSGEIAGYLDAGIETALFALTGFTLSASQDWTLGVGLLCSLLMFACLVWSFGKHQFSKTLSLLSLVGILIAPVAILFFHKPRVVYPRYFLISIVILYLLASILIDQAWTRGPRMKRYFVASLLILFSATHLYCNYRLLRYGRGQYRLAINDILQESSIPTSIASDHYIRNRIVLDFNAQSMGRVDDLRYLEKPVLASSEYPQWYLTHSQDPFEKPVDAQSLFDTQYDLVKHYPFCGASGWSWSVYNRRN